MANVSSTSETAAATLAPANIALHDTADADAAEPSNTLSSRANADGEFICGTVGGFETAKELTPNSLIECRCQELQAQIIE